MTFFVSSTETDVTVIVIDLAVTDSDGAVTVEGFKGEYIITYGEKTAKFTIDDGIDTAKIVF